MLKYFVFLLLSACTLEPQANYGKPDSGGVVHYSKDWTHGKGCAGVTCYVDKK